MQHGSVTPQSPTQPLQSKTQKHAGVSGVASLVVKSTESCFGSSSSPRAAHEEVPAELSRSPPSPPPTSPLHRATATLDSHALLFRTRRVCFVCEHEHVVCFLSELDFVPLLFLHPAPWCRAQAGALTEWARYFGKSGTSRLGAT